MKDAFTWLTPKQGAELVGCSTRHIQNLIQRGQLSATREDGKYYIDKSEFFRVFPEAHKRSMKKEGEDLLLDHARMEVENGYLKEIAQGKDKINEAKDKEIEFLRSQLQRFTEVISNQTRLIEHKAIEHKAVEQFNEKGEETSTSKRSWFRRFIHK